MKCLQIQLLIKAKPIEKISKVIVTNIAPVKIHFVDFKKLEIYKQKLEKERKNVTCFIKK